MENEKYEVLKVEWVDASFLGLGAFLQIGGVTVKDTAWLPKDKSEIYTNITELDTVFRGVKMAMALKLNKLQLFTDSVTFFF